MRDVDSGRACPEFELRTRDILLTGVHVEGAERAGTKDRRLVRRLRRFFRDHVRFFYTLLSVRDSEQD